MYRRASDGHLQELRRSSHWRGGGDIILPDHEIIKLCQPTTLVPISPHQYPSQMKEIDQVPMIEPFNESQVEPASYDVRLGKDFKIFQRDSNVAIDFANPEDITRSVHVPHGDYLTLHPGEFALGATHETVHMPDNLVARIEGKSSVGRLGLMVHVTAGFIDPGFNGPITLEMYGVHPLALMLRPGMKIAQLSFHTMLSAARKPYSGRYQNAKGVESSKYGQIHNHAHWHRRQFPPDDTGATGYAVPQSELRDGFGGIA